MRALASGDSLSHEFKPQRSLILKTVFFVFPWSSCRFTSMLASIVSREEFIDSVISFLRTHGFDGLDLFFLYPGLRGSPMNDRWKFLFLVEVRPIRKWFYFSFGVSKC